LTHAKRRNLALAVLAAFIAIVVLSACGTSHRALPSYERPLAKTDFQNVRTTAYTHTESDHREYSNHNALGGELHAAGPPIHRAEVVRRAIPAYEVPRAIPVDETAETDVRRASYSPQLQPFSMSERRTTTTVRTRNGRSTSPSAGRLVYGSAAADWSRWPAGTIFRLLSTGQIYRVEDYGWALSGRNTIDLYMANSRDMNSWGAREEAIQVVQWGDPQQSLQFLQRHQDYKHIKRMVLELEGRHKEAAALR
jgi:3D (Asp-Asp-Asp) domain-containing protein